MSSLQNVIDEWVRPSKLCEPLEGGRVRCLACGHRCPIFDGQRGICKVRYNRNGRLYAPYGYVAADHADPIEKKPFFHVLPGGLAFSFGMLGCDLHCGYCQNWLSSQALRDPAAGTGVRQASPEDLIERALASGADAVVSTYNEPLISVEWAVEVFRLARGAGLLTGVVSNGNATPEVLEFLRPWLDLFKVDLKSFDRGRYRELGGRLAPILDSIRRIHRMGLWIEVVTLLVPDFNDSEDELGRLAGFLASVSPDIPWHVTAFHPDYKMTGGRATRPDDLHRAAEIGQREGLRFVYRGNRPGEVGSGEDTICPGCGATVIRRSGFRVLEQRVTAGGACPDCRARLPGRWCRIPLPV
ncbi:MAG: AmmeMemoRadiSam system radical SAM enzyme [Acidobacteria bacterium]|nr:AmmeMemoRadiSam system radical SAM enzyme [Acidobacteriota bacterium]